ncbi:MAG: AraC family transcriptional regulator [Hydrococcus sp. RU_2_2]|jgi:AraC-like DNA-binding protein|nr:AraC family transcriptional regulator [Hydrococcus sp. Prado102]NJM86170.1 AraC family transcriptional regulator [Hydrococcus sp. RU_2_2]NJP19128.1 AraC family transcriptional regulator [Hydrococcus sp. CRU_1_1]
MDALSEVFKTVCLERTTCYRMELSAPWGVRMEAFDGAIFLVMVRGSGWLEVDGIETQLPLVGGDLVFLQKGQAHTLRECPESHVIDFDRLLDAQTDEVQKALHIGGAGLSTTVMYGRLQFEQLSENPLLSALPPLIVIRGEDGQKVEWLDMTMQFMSSEMTANRPGAQTVIDHLASILLVQAMRAYISNTGDCDRCWLRALREPAIGEAISLIHRYPEKSWTAEDLAEQVRMSRTAFFVKFRDLVGEPPNKYLTRWRMHRASQILRLEHMSLNQVAHLVGYESEAAFSKTFKQWMGQSPGAYRKE